MAFIINKIDIKTQIKKFDDFYIDAMRKGISVIPFDIYAYVNTFESIEIIDDDLKSLGLIERAGHGFVVAVDKYYSINLRRIILARLFAHFVLHKDYIIDNRKIEIQKFWTADIMAKEAIDFASKLLIPKATFLEYIKNGSTTFDEAKRFGVTPKFMTYRCFNLGLVKEFQF